MNVVLKPLDNTLWVYIPLEKPMIEVKASDQPPAPLTDKATEKTNIDFIDGKFENGTFKIEYDIGKSKKYGADFGYSSALSEEYQTKQRNAFTSIYRAYVDVDEVPGQGTLKKAEGDVDYAGSEKNLTHKTLVHSYLKTEKVPDFFVVVIADVITGLERKITFYFSDLKRSMTDQFFYEEYAKRIIADNPVGNKSIVGDREGKHLDIQEETWPNFLTKQILNRVRFRYLLSEFPPSDNPEDEILKIVNETTSAYGFEDFQSVELNDLHTDKKYLFDKSQLKTFVGQTGSVREGNLSK